MKRHRLRAPSTDGALLAVPPLGEVASLFRQTAERLSAWDHDFQGRRAGRLRCLVHREVIAAARSFLDRHGLDVPEIQPPVDEATPTPLVVTGHQPELYHPGVWVKNFATASLARAHRGIGLNLIVDNDIPKSSSIRVPVLAGDRARVVRVEFDQWQGELPYEDLKVHDERVFASFRDRALRVLKGAIPDPILVDFWPRAVRQTQNELAVGLRLALARRELEAEWGIHNLEIPLSEVCQTEGFAWFACHLLAQLPRFVEIHNQTLAEYRAVYGIRSKNHPVSALVGKDDWLEAPFWVWREGQPRRRALLVRQLSRTMQLRIGGEDERLIELPLSPDREACCAVEQLHVLRQQSVRLRTRALTTTMFCRYLLGDLFLHGIGGAKYDELGDAIARRFFGIDPPGFVTLSLTSWLGLPARNSAASDLASIDRGLRDLEYNPDRYLGEPLGDETRKLLLRKQEAIAFEGNTRSERLARFRTIRSINEALQPLVRASAHSLQTLRSHVLADLHWNRVVQDREYSFVLHSQERLRHGMAGVEQGLGGSPAWTPRSGR
jgi:hypothetical protein